MTDQFGRLRRDGLGWIADLFKGIDRRLKFLEGLSPDQLGGTQGRIVVVENKAESAADQAQNAALEAQQATLDSQQAQLDALQAKLDAANASEQTTQLQQSIAQPGVNKFDTAPIVAQNINGYDTVNLTGYSWVTGGVRLQTPTQTAVGVNLFAKDIFAVRPGDVLSASVNLTFDDPAVAGFGWSFFDADGQPISSSASSIATEDGLLQSQYQVPSSAASLKMNLFAYVPNGYTVTRTWVEFRNPYVGILVGSNGLAKEAVKRVNIAPGAVGVVELDPSISFTPADGSITTPKLANGAATDEKIASVSALKLTDYVPLANLDRHIAATFAELPTTGLTAGRSTAFTTSDGMEYTRGVGVWIPINAPTTASVPHAEFTASTSGFANNTVTLVGAFSADTANSNTSTLATPVSSGIVRINAAGNYTIAAAQATATAGVTSRSFVDIERLAGSTWVREGRWTIANGEDSVASALNGLRLTGTNTQLRFTVYRNVPSTSYAFTTRIKIDRIGDA